MAEPAKLPGEENPPPRTRRRSAEEGRPTSPVAQHRTLTTLSLDPGAELQVTRSRRPSYRFEGGKFYQMSLPMSLYLGKLRLSGAEYALLHVLTGSQARGGLIEMTQKEIAKKVRTGRSDVSRTLKKFRGWGLVIQVGNGLYRINPRVAFYGTSEEQEAVLSELYEDLPELRLPRIPGDD